MSSKRSSSRSHENEDFSLRLRELLTNNKKKKRNATKVRMNICLTSQLINLLSIC